MTFSQFPHSTVDDHRDGAHSRCKFGDWLWGNSELRTNTMCGEAFSAPLLCVVLGNFHCAITNARLRESCRTTSLAIVRGLFRDLTYSELKLKLERNLGCCFMATKVGKPSPLLCPGSGISTYPEGTNRDQWSP